MFIEIFALLLSFVSPQEWHDRPLKGDEKGIAAKVSTRVRHEHSFYADGSDSGFFNDGVHADSPKNLDRYGKLPQKNGELCRVDSYMKEAERNVADRYKSEDYKFFTHNCQDYKKDVNKEYDKIFKEKGLPK
jgi:hypothetical protein